MISSISISGIRSTHTERPSLPPPLPPPYLLAWISPTQPPENSQPANTSPSLLRALSLFHRLEPCSFTMATTPPKPTCELCPCRAKGDSQSRKHSHLQSLVSAEQHLARHMSTHVVSNFLRMFCACGGIIPIDDWRFCMGRSNSDRGT